MTMNILLLILIYLFVVRTWFWRVNFKFVLVRPYDKALEISRLLLFSKDSFLQLFKRAGYTGLQMMFTLFRLFLPFFSFE